MLVDSGGEDLLQNVLNAERSLYLNVGLSGGGDPLLNDFKCRKITIP